MHKPRPLMRSWVVLAPFTIGLYLHAPDQAPRHGYLVAVREGGGWLHKGQRKASRLQTRVLDQALAQFLAE